MHNNFSHKPFAFLREDTQELIFEKSSALIKKYPAKSSSTHKIQSEHVAQDMEEHRLFLQAVNNIPKHKTTSGRRRKNSLKSVHRESMTALTCIGDALNFSELFPKTDMPKKKKKARKFIGKAPMTHSEIPKNIEAVIEAIDDAELSMEHLLAQQELRAQGQAGEDTKAFAAAMHEVNPLKGKGRAIAKCIEPANVTAQDPESFANLMERKVEFALSLKGEYLEGHVVGLDALTMDNLRSGIYSPEAHLDLHGLNANQAYQALVTFFRTSWYKGMRTVLLVPGRGKHSHSGFAVLRDKLQLWLTQDPFKRVVLAFCTAKATDGGAGTMYVLLRKYKKKGKINWERLPADPDLY